MGVVVREINNVKIEKFVKETCLKKKANTGKELLIQKKNETWHRALSPGGVELYKNKQYSAVKKFAQGCQYYSQKVL